MKCINCEREIEPKEMYDERVCWNCYMPNALSLDVRLFNRPKENHRGRVLPKKPWV